MSEKLQKLRKHYLGQTAIVRTRKDEKSDARELFLRAVEQHAPEVLQDLRKQVYDRWNERARQRGAPIPRYLHIAIRGWATRWNLTRKCESAEWIVHQVESTLTDWAQHPKLAGHYWGTFPGFHEHLPVYHLFEISEALHVLAGHAVAGSPWDRIEQRARSVELKHKRLEHKRLVRNGLEHKGLEHKGEARQFTFAMAVSEVLRKDPDLYAEYLNAPSHHTTVVACMPTKYPLRQIKEALRSLKANVQQVLEHSNSDLQFRTYLATKSQLRPLEKARSIDKDHFVWAVRFQCLGHTYAEIAACKGIDWAEHYQNLNKEKLSAAESTVPAIRVGIRDTLALVKLPPRPGPKVGLPKVKEKKFRH